MGFLRKFLRLGIGASEATITGTRRPLGYEQITAVTLAASSALNIPAALPSLVVGYAVIQANGAAVRWRDDGTDPTASVGMVIPSGGELNYVGDFTKIRFILVSGSPTVDVSYYA